MGLAEQARPVPFLVMILGPMRTHAVFAASQLRVLAVILCSAGAFQTNPNSVRCVIRLHSAQ